MGTTEPECSASSPRGRSRWRTGSCDPRYWELDLATSDPVEITTDQERIYFAYDGGDTFYAIKIGRDGPVMEQVSEGAQLRQRFYSMLGELLLESHSSLGDPEQN